MRTLQASIWKGDKVLVDNVTVYLEEETSPGGLKSWYGVFQLPVMEHIEPDTFRIELDDGRGGEILISHVTMSSQAPTQVTFTGSGPLAATDAR